MALLEFFFLFPQTSSFSFRLHVFLTLRHPVPRVVVLRLRCCNPTVKANLKF